MEDDNNDRSILCYTLLQLKPLVDLKSNDTDDNDEKEEKRRIKQQ